MAISFEWLFEADTTGNAMIPHLPNSSTHIRTSLRSAAILIASHKTIVSFSVSSFPIRLQDAPPIVQNICRGFCEKVAVTSVSMRSDIQFGERELEIDLRNP
jgi:hypothetical protein